VQTYLELKEFNAQLNPKAAGLRRVGIFTTMPLELPLWQFKRYSDFVMPMTHTSPPTSSTSSPDMPLASPDASAPAVAETVSNEQLAQALAVLSRAAKGSVEADRAFATLYEATVDRVYGVAQRFLRHDHLAEEVVEEVYCQAWRDAASHDASRGPVIAWLLVMARSRALDLLRKLRNSPIEYSADAESMAQELASELASEDPFSMLASSAEQGVVHQALALLKGPARQMVSLAFMRGLTHQEISDTLHQPLGTVKTTIRRALQSMRSIIEQQAPQLAQQYSAQTVSALLTPQENDHESA
jgi:RNA polymerase sigma factor (sigma-70 family)